MMNSVKKLTPRPSPLAVSTLYEYAAHCPRPRIFPMSCDTGVRQILHNTWDVPLILRKDVSGHFDGVPLASGIWHGNVTLLSLIRILRRTTVS